MSSVSIKFYTDNAAFDEENGNFEVSRILSKLASDIERGLLDVSTNIRDINGNTIGSCEFFPSNLDECECEVLGGECPTCEEEV